MTEPSNELKTLMQNSLQLTEAALINLLNTFNNHDFRTLNYEADMFLQSGFDNVLTVTNDLIIGLEVTDLKSFINDCLDDIKTCKKEKNK